MNLSKVSNISGNHEHISVSTETFVVAELSLSLIFLIGIFENSCVLLIFAKARKVRISCNTFLVGLAISDLLQTLFGIPLVVISSYAKTWLFGHSGCEYYAFMMTFLGIAQITLLTVISVDRYLRIVKNNSAMSGTKLTPIIFIMFSFGNGLMWAVFPLIGWNSFVLEEFNISCSVKWGGKSVIDLSYSFSIMAFAWVLPLMVIVYCYGNVIYMLWKRARKPMRRSLSENRRKTRMKREMSVAITVLIMIGAFVVSWMPYSIVSLMSVFGEPESIPTMVHMVPALFAKSSIIWNPIIYVARHNDFRRACLKLLPTCDIVRKLGLHGLCSSSMSPTHATYLAVTHKNIHNQTKFNKNQQNSLLKMEESKLTSREKNASEIVEEENWSQRQAEFVGSVSTDSSKLTSSADREKFPVHKHRRNEPYSIEEGSSETQIEDKPSE